MHRPGAEPKDQQKRLRCIACLEIRKYAARRIDPHRADGWIIWCPECRSVTQGAQP